MHSETPINSAAVSADIEGTEMNYPLPTLLVFNGTQSRNPHVALTPARIYALSVHCYCMMKR